MGRRALRRIDPGVDLTPWLKTFDDLPQPWDSLALFEHDQPLEVELGSGKGLFISTEPRARPEHNFLGLEVAAKYAEHCAARIARQRLPNAVMVSGDGLRVFREVLPTSGVVAVHVYFPDPWWKARHKKRRVINPDFLRDVVRVLTPGGTLHFWTDVEEYFNTALELIAAEPLLAGPLPVSETAAEHDLDYRTHFERRMRQHNKPVYRSEFRRA